jgi:hypothetical protein
MERMLPVELAVFLELELFLRIFPVLLRGIVFSLAFRALEGDQLYGLFLRSHLVILSRESKRVFQARSAERLYLP